MTVPSSIPLSGAGARPADLDPLVQKLFGRADHNHDGQVSRSEFAAFLDQLVETARTHDASPDPHGQAVGDRPVSTDVTTMRDLAHALAAAAPARPTDDASNG